MGSDALREQFQAYERHKVQRAITATIPPIATLVDRSHLFALEWVEHPLIEWFWGGPFYHAPAGDADVPATNLVFVQDANGNTGSDEPESLGGGDTDLLLYELGSRVYVDAIIAGSATIANPANPAGTVLSVWHPEGVALRTQLGKRRHPINVVATEQGNLFIEEGLVYNTPDVEVVILTGARGKSRLDPRLQHRSWVHVEATGEPPDLGIGFTLLRQKYGVRFASAVGGRRIATQLLDHNLISDLYLTTTPRVVVPPHPPTPFYLGNHERLEGALDLILSKRVSGPEGDVHLAHHRVGPL